MSRYSSDKNYIYYPNTDIPINKLNIRDLLLLEEEERKLLLKAYEYFHKDLSASIEFDEKYLLNLYKTAFQSLYDFAGKYRTLNVSKGYSTFCQVRFLEQTAKEIFTQLKNDNYLKDYSNKPKAKFAERIAYYMCELNALHPFFELNGRTIRLFFDMITTYNGYEYIDYEDALEIEDGENKFIIAAIDCMSGDNNKMYNIIFNGLKKASSYN